MSFTWLILTLIIIIFAGNSRSYWGDYWSGGSTNPFGNSRRIRKSRSNDFEMRLERRTQMAEETVVVHADDYIRKPDQVLEELIGRGDLEGAKEYRQDMEKIADEMDDDNGLRKYAIYGARISKMEKKSGGKKSRLSFRRVEAAPFAVDKPVPEPYKPKVTRPAPEVQTIKAADTIGKFKESLAGKDGKPPLWEKKSTPPSVIPDPPKTEPARPTPLKPEHPVKPTPPPEPVKAEIERPPVKPIPADYTPAPAGPIQLGRDTERYTSGPIKTGDFGKSETKPESEPEEEEKKVDPDEYSDLMSF